MTRKAVLKMAGYEVKTYSCVPRKYRWWCDDNGRRRGSVLYPNETQAWTSAWRHMKGRNETT